MSASASAGAARAARLLVGLRLRRFLNQVPVAWQAMRRKEITGKRTATPGKARLGWLLAGVVGISMMFTVANLASQGLANMQRVLGSVEAAGPGAKAPAEASPTSQKAPRVALPAAEGNTLPAGVVQAVALELLILLVAAFLLSLGSGDLAKPDWDIEWLVTLPVSLATLLSVRIAERTVLSAAYLLLWPFLTIVAWEAGYGIAAAAALGLLAALPLLAIIATLRTIIDTGLRLSVSPGALRNLQAVMGVAAVLFLYLGMSPGMSHNSYVMDWAPLLPGWAFWSPPGLATIALTATDKASIGLSYLALVLQAGLLAAAGLAVMLRQLKLGIVAAGARESGRRPAAKPARGAAGAGPEKRTLLTPVQARELRLLSRDRTFLVQSLVLPVLVIGAQFWFGTGGDLYASALGTPKGLAVIAFSMAAYALMFSAFQTLNTEGNALWILYSVPHPIEQVLRQKAILWGIVCLVYPLAIFAFVMVSGMGTSEMLGLAPIVLAGVPIFAVIATALGVFACDPLAQVVQRRLRPSYMYLYMLLASLYAYAIFASTVWQRASLMVLTALLGLSLWQKARDHLPYLLDPSASPPARVSLSDGLIAAMMFFVVQGLVGLIFVLSGQKEPTGRALLIGFSVAGAVTFLQMRFVFWRLKSEGVPRTFGAGYSRALALGAGGGAAAALGAFAYLLLAQHTSLLEGARESVLVSVQDQLWIAVLAVAAAPIFEEFIFRGLIFGGLRRTLGPVISVLASAAIFALVHPPFSVIPVFGLGIATALVYERTRLLIGPVAVHAVYNAAVVGAQYLPGL
jgi:hypothetical protein